MLVGVMSDSHDNLLKVRAATTLFRKRGAEVILHAGDVVAPFAVRAILKAGIPLVGVFGNCDGERTGMKKVCRTFYRSPHRFELDARVLVLAHDPEDLRGEVAAGADLLVHGHTHNPAVKQGRPLVLNPGETGGWLTGKSSVALVDLATLKVEIVDLGPQETLEL
jgi:hypothetical protein